MEIVKNKMECQKCKLETDLKTKFPFYASICEHLICSDCIEEETKD